ncbi:hypothetical protein BU15DRAFT_68126 [Melanogaster broomeanus]|nr:hypothetical protein BU15DRAFT_68126 [Melanogaster broomeanus]
MGLGAGSGRVYGGTLEEQAGAFEVWGGVGSVFEVRGGVFEVRGGAFEVQGGAGGAGGAFEVRGSVGGAFEIMVGVWIVGGLRSKRLLMRGQSRVACWMYMAEMVEDDLGLESWEASHGACAPGHVNVKAAKVLCTEWLAVYRWRRWWKTHARRNTVHVHLDA